MVQEARIWPPVNGQHPKLKDAKEAYPDIPKGHPKLLMLWADKSEFGKWVWLPKNKNYYGSTPRNGIAVRVEKVRINGRERRIVGYGTRVRDIHCWYDFEEVLAFFSLYFEPDTEDLAFPNTENFIRRLETGRWNTYRHPDMPEEERNGRENEENGQGNEQDQYQYEQYQDQYQEQFRGRGRSGNRRGRGPSRGDRGPRGGFHPRGGRYGRF